MATGYWRLKAVSGNFQLFDHLPNATTRTTLVVKVTIPGAATEETLAAGIIGGAEDYTLDNPWSNPVKIEPADVTAETGSTFRDGIYRFNVSYDIGGTVYSFDERILYIPIIDAAISTKLDAYLAGVCDKCANGGLLDTLQELVSLRQGAQLDLNAGRNTAAAKKVTLMSNISTGASCNCICGC
jgi:hypothetical protein